MSETLAWTWADVGFAPALIADAGHGLCLLAIGEERARDVLERWRARHAPDAVEVPAEGARAKRLDQVREQLAQYGAGTRRSFEVGLDLRGTDFEREVWAALLRIPFGSTSTYGELAAALGRRGGARAVGGAAGRNPVPIVVPCHRLLASAGLGGFTGGLDQKRALLGLEGHSIENQLRFP